MLLDNNEYKDYMNALKNLEGTCLEVTKKLKLKRKRITKESIEFDDDCKALNNGNYDYILKKYNLVGGYVNSDQTETPSQT